MKKFIIALLCLLLVLPLNAFAEETENQPAAQSEDQSQSQSENQNSEQSGNQNSDQSGSQNSDQSGSQNPDQSGGNDSGQSESKPEESKPSESQPSESKPAETVPSDHKHVWDVTYTIPATCKDEGATGKGCSACGAISVEVLPKLTTHTYDNVCDPHCNVCDLNREVTHKFSTQWTKNASGHWHACSVCGEKCDFGNHYPGPAATEEKAQICLTCGYTLTAKLGHSHKYETKWTSDESGHWYACTGCDDQKDFADHTFDSGCDPDCNVCGYVTATAHTYSGTWYSDETGHWDVCTICQETSPVEPHIPGEEATDTQAQLCLACSFELTPALVPTEHVHQGEGTWLTDADNHWKACTCGEETDKQPHHWDEGEEQEDGVVLYTCEDCGAIRTEEAEKDEGSSMALIWMGVAIAALLGAAAVIAFLVLPKVSKGGKYGR